MKIAITGSRGIPNNYGGFEQCAENLAVLLSDKGHEVTVYNPTYHEYKAPTFKNVKIEYCWNPEKKIGTIGNFIYDYSCLRHAIKNNSEIVLVLGYTTASVFFPLINKRKSVLVTNMDGLEWKRDKWNWLVKKLALFFEKLGAKYSDYLVSDNGEIKNYLQQTYNKDSTFIAYGAILFEKENQEILSEYQVQPYKYDLLIARLEKENNIETILDGCIMAKKVFPCLVIGNHKTKYGEWLKKKYAQFPEIKFIGGIYNLEHLNNLRHYSRFYFHGHSVGGTNPSLLEAMASNAFIVAHNNLFNRDVLESNANYFSSPAEISELINNEEATQKNRASYILANKNKIKDFYNWQKITDEYENLFKTLLPLYNK